MRDGYRSFGCRIEPKSSQLHLSRPLPTVLGEPRGGKGLTTTSFDSSLLPIDPPPLSHHIRHHVPLQLFPSVPPPLPDSTNVGDSDVLELGFGLSDPFGSDVELSFTKGSEAGLEMLEDGVRAW